MSTILEYVKYLVDTPDKVGDLGMRLEGIPGIPTYPEGVVVLNYKVPSGSYITLEGITITCLNGQNQNSTIAPATITNAGTAKIRVGGVDKMEFRLHAFSPLAGTPAGDGITQSWHNANQRINFGDGITVPSGELIVTAAPAAANTGLVFFATIYSIASGVSYITKGKLIVNATTANQSIAEHKPGLDTEILSVDVEAVTTGANIIKSGRIELNGSVIFEFGDMGNDNTESCFMGDDYTNQGCFHIPLSGLELQQNDRISVIVHPVCDADHNIVAQLIGNTTAYSTGSGSGGVSRARSFVGI